MNHPRLALLLAAALSVSTAARAAVEEGYTAADASIPSTWYGPVDPAAMRADRGYISGMRPHHAGALTMSEQYLADPEARSPVLRALAMAIIRNQRFEIGLMDEIARNLDQPPMRINLALFSIALQPMATEGVAQMQRFIRSPIPGPADGLAGGGVSARDVQFAKGMTIHHRAALTMANAYLANAAARNGFLGLMNVDVITDQTQEIALMQSVIAAYPGDPDLVQVDASMIHGMEGMAHGGAEQPHDGMTMPADSHGHPGNAMPASPPARRAISRPAPAIAAPPAAHDGHHH